MEALFAQTLDQPHIDLNWFTLMYVNLRWFKLIYKYVYIDLRLFMSRDSQNDGQHMQKQEDK